MSPPTQATEPDSPTADSPTTDSPTTEMPLICVWAIDELLAHVELVGTHAQDCGTQRLGSGPSLGDGIDCVLQPQGNTGAQYMTNDCPDCMWEKWYLTLSDGQHVFIKRNTLNGEPTRTVSVDLCVTFDSSGACTEPSRAYACEDQAGY